MQHALYPKRFGDNCPYCGGENIRNDNDILPTAGGCNVECVCNDCGRSHHLNYSVTSITLENNDGVVDTDFHYPIAELQDQGVDEPGNVPAIPVAIVASSQGIMLMAAGYGDGASSPGYGAPVIVENYNGTLRVIVWDDINNDDACEIFELGNARYCECEPDQDYPFRAIRYTPDNVQIEEHPFQDVTDAKQFAAERLAAIPAHYALVRNIVQDTIVWDSRE